MKEVTQIAKVARRVVQNARTLDDLEEHIAIREKVLPALRQDGLNWEAQRVKGVLKVLTKAYVQKDT